MGISDSNRRRCADCRLFLFEPGLIYLNHSGFGATPKEVLDPKQRILVKIEKNPPCST